MDQVPQLPEIDRDRITALAKTLRKNKTLRAFVTQDADVVANMKDLHEIMAFVIEILYLHLPNAVQRLNGYESVYTIWFNKLQLYDVLAQEVINSKNYPDTVKKLLTQLGYLERNVS